MFIIDSIDWAALGDILLLTAVTYFFLVFVLRFTGKRTTSKMNSFDWIVSVALGSMVATVILVDDVSLIQGLTGIAALVFLQYTVAWIAARSESMRGIVKASPRLLFYDGEFDDNALRQERLSHEEVLASVRAEGHASLNCVSAVVMETNSDLSVIPKSDTDELDVLKNVSGWDSANSEIIATRGDNP